MDAVNSIYLAELLSRFEMKAAEPHLGIGMELSYVVNAPRIIVVNFAASDAVEYLLDVTTRILKLEDEWLLVPRYGSAIDLGLLDANQPAAAIRFDSKEQQRLAEYLCTRDTHLASISADLYVLAASGGALVTWDHHTADEGLSVQLRRVTDAAQLLASLNELGAELELYYTDG